MDRWLAVFFAAVSALGGFGGAAISKSEDVAVLKSQMAELTSSYREHNAHGRELDSSVTARLADIDARLRLLEQQRERR